MEFTSYRQVTSKRKNLLTLRSLETNNSSQPCPWVKNSHGYAPDGGGELAAGDVGPTQANKWHGSAIEGTTDLLVEDLGSGNVPTSADGGTSAAAPSPARIRVGLIDKLRHELQGGLGQGLGACISSESKWREKLGGGPSMAHSGRAESAAGKRVRVRGTARGFL
jgi:hypothetical protein